MVDIDADDVLKRANKQELRAMVLAYRFLLLSKGGTVKEFKLAENTATRLARSG